MHVAGRPRQPETTRRDRPVAGTRHLGLVGRADWRPRVLHSAVRKRAGLVARVPGVGRRTGLLRRACGRRDGGRRALAFAQDTVLERRGHLRAVPRARRGYYARRLFFERLLLGRCLYHAVGRNVSFGQPGVCAAAYRWFDRARGIAQLAPSPHATVHDARVGGRVFRSSRRMGAPPPRPVWYSLPTCFYMACCGFSSNWRAATAHARYWALRYPARSAPRSWSSARPCVFTSCAAQGVFAE